ncbi:MAG: AAA family ATPase [Pararhodobacter sp.]
MLCGKIAAGKSTLASRLGRESAAVLLAEDDWLNALFSDQMSSGAEYVRCSSRLRKIMGPHVSALLRAGVSVVLDFPANTVEQRDWMRGLYAATGASHQLHVLDVPDELCLARLRERNARGDHSFAPTEAQFRRFSSYFVMPTPEEGFNIVAHDQPA